MSDPSNLEHLDEVVSAYVDGEATPEEVRLVEGDPALLEQARLLTELVAMDQVVPEPNAAMKQRHLSAAMAAFEAPTATTAAPVVDLTPAAAEVPVQEKGTAPVIDLTSRRRGPAGLPRWLTAAAGTLVVLGGIGFVINQNDASEDSAATDTTESAEEVFSSRPADDDDASAGDAAQAMDDDAMEDDAMEDDAMEDEAMEEESAAMEDEVAEDSASATTAVAEADEEASGDVDTELSDDDAGDIQTATPLIEVSDDATIEDLLVIVDPFEGAPFVSATCADGFTTAMSDVEDRVGPFNGDGDSIDVFSLLLGGEVTEFFVVNTIDGARSGVLFGPDCTMIDR